MSTIIPTTRRMMASVGRGVTTWLVRVSSRNELSSLSDRDLRDIGISLCDTRREAAKPFWMA
jgi:uncharacterized protein YjiS (DUF1127 family)